jgi:uncharacterized membrane protein YhiD involved in acid resistance
MWGAIISSLIAAIASFFGYKREQVQRENTKEVIANKTAQDETSRQDEVETKIQQASNDDEKALDDLRRMASE